MTDTTNQTAAETDGPSPGAMLREAREASGLSPQEAAVKLHLHQRIIIALENDDAAQLPSSIYVRGYLRNYARLLGLDSQKVLAAYDGQDSQHPELRPPLTTPSQASSSDKPVKAVTYLITLGLVVLLLAWWQSRHLDNAPMSIESSLDSRQGPGSEVGDSNVTDTRTDAAQESIVSPLGYPIRIVRHPDTPAAAVGEQPATDAAPATDAERGAAATAEAAPTDSSAAELLETLPEVGERSGASDSEAITDTADEAGDNSASAATDTTGNGLRLVIDQDSWVEVYDAGGQRLYHGLARSGDTVEVSGTAPLRVLLGYAPGVNVTYNGKRIDTIEHSQAGVAQFRVGPDIANTASE